MLVEIGIPRDIGARLSDFSDVDIELWELITNVPKVTSPWNVLLALLNVFFPGVGTFLSSLWGEPCSKTQALIGLCQFCMSFLLIGWIWSLVWSYFIIKKSCSSAEMVKFYSKLKFGEEARIGYTEA